MGREQRVYKVLSHSGDQSSPGHPDLLGEDWDLLQGYLRTFPFKLYSFKGTARIQGNGSYSV